MLSGFLIFSRQTSERVLKMFEDYNVRGNYHCVEKRVRVYDDPRLGIGGKWEESYDDGSFAAMCIHPELVKEKGHYSQPIDFYSRCGEYGEEPETIEYEYKLNYNFKFFVREVFDKWHCHYFYETYLKFEFKKEDQKFDFILYNVTVLTKRITENGYSDSPILNERLTLENLMELYQHCFKKNVHELCFMRFPKIMDDCFDAGKDQIKEQTQNFFSNVLGIRGGGW